LQGEIKKERPERNAATLQRTQVINDLLRETKKIFKGTGGYKEKTLGGTANASKKGI